VNPPSRSVITGLSLSATALVALLVQEGYFSTASIPTKGDVPTVGFGMTERPDGTPVKLGDTTTPVAAVQRTLNYTQKVDAQIKQCVTAPVFQAEYDIMADFSYQYGVAALCKSSMVRLANAEDYAGSCKAYLAYKLAAGYDCSTPGNKRCPGVWTRSQWRYSNCMAAQ
jgi:GH24 family phage-related lysozyme (muramidase)